jgi:hypothetical protein
MQLFPSPVYMLMRLSIVGTGNRPHHNMHRNHEEVIQLQDISSYHIMTFSENVKALNEIQ